MKKNIEEQVVRQIWKISDKLRSRVGGGVSENYDYILALLFLKLLSREEHGAKKDFSLPDDCQFPKLYAQKNTKEIGELIDEVFRKIEQAYFERLKGVFQNISFNSESRLGKAEYRRNTISIILDGLNEINFDYSVMAGDIFSGVLDIFATSEGKKRGLEFTSPQAVSSLLVKILKVKKGDKIYDPASGTASTLCAFGREALDGELEFYGQEINRSYWAISQMLLFLYEFENADIRCGDSIRKPLHIKNGKLKTFDIVCGIPPFSISHWGDELAQNDEFGRFQWGIPPKSKGDYAFISHMLSSMDKKTGRMGVIMPLGVLYRGGAEEKIRTNIINDNLLDAVIELPENLFFATTIPTTLLVFKRNKKDKDVLFINASKNYDRGHLINRLRNEDIEKILDTYNQRESIELFSYLASLEEIKENDFNLMVKRYVSSSQPREKISIKALIKEIEDLEQKIAINQKKQQEILRNIKG